jgi:hypothetical protein
MPRTAHRERTFHPGQVRRRSWSITPGRAIFCADSEDRGVTTSLRATNRKGDQLVADDHKVYKVVRVVGGAGVVELQCLDAPTRMYVAKKDLHLYFLGRRAD